MPRQPSDLCKLLYSSVAMSRAASRHLSDSRVSPFVRVHQEPVPSTSAASATDEEVNVKIDMQDLRTVEEVGDSSPRSVGNLPRRPRSRSPLRRARRFRSRSPTRHSKRRTRSRSRRSRRRSGSFSRSCSPRRRSRSSSRWRSYGRYSLQSRRRYRYPFGLCSAPRIFSKIMKEVVSFYRAKGTRMVVYLDDMLFLHQESVLGRGT